MMIRSTTEEKENVNMLIGLAHKYQLTTPSSSTKP